MKNELLKFSLSWHLDNYDGFSIKKFMNSELDMGIYDDLYVIAVKSDNLTRDEIEEIIIELEKRDPESMKFIKFASSYIIDRKIWGTNTEYCIVDSGNVLWTDGLRIHRISSGLNNWISDRVSYDGIIDLRYVNNTVTGNGLYYGRNGDADWCDFIIDYVNGHCIKGITVN
jgi:hypothetical protein